MGWTTGVQFPAGAAKGAWGPTQPRIQWAPRAPLLG